MAISTVAWPVIRITAARGLIEAGPLEHLQPADSGHDHVGHDDVEFLLFDPGQRLLAAAGGGDAVAFVLQE